MLIVALGVALSWLQAPCPPEMASLVDEASVRAAEFDLPAASEQLSAAAMNGCADAQVAALFVRGLVDAREAFRQGGSPQSLMPVRQAMAALEAVAQNRRGPAEIARLMLHAAAAAAQSERDEMRVYLDAAITMETLERAAGRPGAPVVTAAELAGDLWLQVHRYEEARQSYRDAKKQAGSTLRVLAGLARASARLNDAPEACVAFRELVEQWGVRTAEPPEISEAHEYLRSSPACPAAP